MHLLFYNFGQIFGGIIIGFIKGYIFTFIILAVSPIIFLSMYVFIKNELKGLQIFKDAYAQAGAISDETFIFIKNVK